MSNRIMQHFPDFYDEIQDFRELDKTESIELDSLSEAIEQLFNNQFVLTSDEKATKRREKILGIQANPVTESLDFRKKRILNRYQTKPPFTFLYLQNRLDFLVGAGRAVIEVDPVSFSFTVTTSIDDAPLFKELEHTIKTTIPANLIYQQQTALQDSITIKESILRKDIKWNYMLDGTWKLGEKPFSSYGLEVVVK
ncbi:putative phage tail protein [Heyndrickxia sporothermodurans]